MASPAVAAAGAAVAVYFYHRRSPLFSCGASSATAAGPADGSAVSAAALAREGQPFMRHTGPTTWLEALYFFAEALRHIYGETLGRWRSADLLIGLAFMARREADERPISDIAAEGLPFADGLQGQQRVEAQAELTRLTRCMSYGLALRNLRPLAQLAVFRSLGIAAEDMLITRARSGVLKPSYFLLIDRRMRSVILLVRGTQSVKDMFTSMTSASKPHHVVDANGVVLGYSHFGMLASARWIKGEVASPLRAARLAAPGFSLTLVGHSMGAGTAAMLTMMLREDPEFADARCVAVACPACMTLELAQSCAGYVTSIVNGADLVPTMSLASADALRLEVMESAWYDQFRADVRSSLIVRAVEASIGGVAAATAATANGTWAVTSWTTAHLASASRSFGSCSRRRLAPKKRRSASGDNLVDLEEWATREQARRNMLRDRSYRNNCFGFRGGLSGSKGTALGPSAPFKRTSSVEVASDWVTAASDGEERAWDSVMSSIQAWGWREEAGGTLDSLPGIQRSSSIGPGTPASWGRGIMPFWGPGRVAGWSTRARQSVGRTTRAVGVRVGQTSSTVYRRTSDLLSQIVLQSCSLGQRLPSVLPGSAPTSQRVGAPTATHASVAAPHSAHQPLLAANEPPSTMHMETSRTSHAHRSQGSLPSPDEIDQQMALVEAAVADEERAESAAEQRRTSQYGAAASGSSPASDHGLLKGSAAEEDSVRSREQTAELAERRKTYPAGRIMHLVPARFVFPSARASHSGISAATQGISAEAHHNTAVKAPDSSSDARSEASSGDSQFDDSELSSSGEEEELWEEMDVPSAPLEYNGVVESPMRQAGIGTGAAQERRDSALPVGSTAGGGAHAADAAAAVGDGGVVDPVAAAVALAGEIENFVLMDNVPQLVYGRMRMCRTMVSDHFTPAYLASMASAVGSFESGYPAERLQHEVPFRNGTAAVDGVPAYGDQASADEMAYGHAKAA